MRSSASQLALLDQLFRVPIVSVRLAEKRLGCSYLTASKAIQGLEQRGIVQEITGRKRDRLFRFNAYVLVLSFG